MIPLAKKLLAQATKYRASIIGHNMTGNTINAYVVAVYVRGILCHIETPSGSMRLPLRKKLHGGEKFYAGVRRWDGDIQSKTFKAPIDTSGQTEPDESIRFIESFKPESNGFALVVCNGVEYATYQENEMNIDVLTANFAYAKMFAPSMFKPMSA